MKKYIKPTIEFVELRVEERLARCYYDPQKKDHVDPIGNPANHSSDLPGNHPGCRYHCPHS